MIGEAGGLALGGGVRVEGTMTDTGAERRRTIHAGAPGSWAGILIAVLALQLALTLPGRIDHITPLAFARLPLELPVLLAVLAIAAGRFGTSVRSVLALLVALTVVLRVADMAAQQAFARPFNPVLDAHLLGAAMNLLSGAVGVAGAWAIAAAAILATLLVVSLSWLVLARLSAGVTRHRRGTLVVAGLLALLWSGLFVTGAAVDHRRPLASHAAASLLAERAGTTLASLGDMRAFAAASAVDAWRDVPSDRLLGALKGKDVLVVFVESYGETVLSNPLYAPRVTALLRQGEARLAMAGAHVRTGLVTSPTVGGMSWLAHGTMLSGLWVDNQRRYDSLMTSDRMTLNGAFRRAGWRTVAVMPAITMAWPEGAYYGYDTIYAADDLGYRGKPFNWVTMPDQYTLSALRRLELDRPDRAPVMAEVALISSHAPWTPIPEVIDWSLVGDGSVFDAVATSGDPPEVVWRDPDRVRTQFRLSIEYALDNLVSYVETFGADNLVMVVLGDHQPAPLVTGEDASRAVPVHVIAGDPAVLDRIESWGWADGLMPDPAAPILRMDVLRDRFLAAFSTEPAADGGVQPSARLDPSRATEFR